MARLFPIAVLVAVLMPSTARSQALPAELVLRGVIGFERQADDTTFFTLSDPRAAVLIRTMNDVAAKPETLSFDWVQALLHSRNQSLWLFSPEDLKVGYVFETQETATAAQCFVTPSKRTSTDASYALRCVADSANRRLLRDGEMIFEVDVVIAGVPNESELDRFLLRALLPKRYPLLVSLERPRPPTGR